MRLTRQTNYALRMLMYCAANKGKLSRIADIANTYRVSELFLFKILQPLVEHGLVETVRGRGGGIRLAKSASDISLREVVELTEDNFAMAECFESETADCPLINVCVLSNVLHEALNAFFNVLSRTTIDDLVSSNPMINTFLKLEPPSHHYRLQSL